MVRLDREPARRSVRYCEAEDQGQGHGVEPPNRKVQEFVTGSTAAGQLGGGAVRTRHENRGSPHPVEHRSPIH